MIFSVLGRFESNGYNTNAGGESLPWQSRNHDEGAVMGPMGSWRIPVFFSSISATMWNNRPIGGPFRHIISLFWSFEFHCGGWVDPEPSELLANVRCRSWIFLSTGLRFVWPFGVWQPSVADSVGDVRSVSLIFHWDADQLQNAWIFSATQRHNAPRRADFALNFKFTKAGFRDFSLAPLAPLAPRSFRTHTALGSSHSARVLKEHWLPICGLLSPSDHAAHPRFADLSVETIFFLKSPLGK